MSDESDLPAPIVPSVSGLVRRSSELVARGLKDAGKLTQTLPPRPTMSLHKAARAGNIQEIRSHIHWGCNVNEMGQDDEGLDCVPLSLAAENGHAAAVELLLSAGADVNGADGTDPLNEAARRYPEIVEILLSHGAAPDGCAPLDGTPLETAAMEGNLKAMRLLIDAGANLNGSDCVTPLGEAVSYGNIEAIEMLLESGCDINHEDGSGLTAFHHACSCSGTSLEAKLEIAEFLLEQGADVYAVDDNGNTALHHVVEMACSVEKTIPTCDWLLNKGLEVNITNTKGKTPLHLAAQSSEKHAIEIVEYLIAKGANVNAMSDDGTPLHAAVGDFMRCGTVEVAEYLIRHGADVNVKASGTWMVGASRQSPQQTPLGRATALGHEQMEELLRRHGGIL